MSEIDEVVADMKRKLEASASDPVVVSMVRAIADKRHAFSVSKGLRCPKALQCKKCWPDVVAAGPWDLCPNTHCERRKECAAPHDCAVKSWGNPS